MDDSAFSRLTMIFLPFVLTVGVFVVGCEKTSAPPPFFDGLKLSYLEVFSRSVKAEDHLWTREIRYEFKQVHDGTFKVSQAVQTERGQGLSEKLEPPPYPMVGENLTIDLQGIVLQGGLGMNFINDLPSYIWLHPKYRAKGKAVIPVIRRVRGRTSWESWKVWPVMFGESGLSSLFYDIETGILVGTEAANGKLKMVLKETNLKELKVAKPRKIVERIKDQ